MESTMAAAPVFRYSSSSLVFIARSSSSIAKASTNSVFGSSRRSTSMASAGKKESSTSQVHRRAYFRLRKKGRALHNFKLLSRDVHISHQFFFGHEMLQLGITVYRKTRNTNLQAVCGFGNKKGKVIIDYIINNN